MTCGSESHPMFLRVLAFFLLSIFYNKTLLPVVRNDLHTPEITALAALRTKKAFGGVLRSPISQRQRARLYGNVAPPSGTFAFCMVLWSDDYVLPAVILMKSLLLHGTVHDLHVLVPKSGSFRVSANSIHALEYLGARVTYVAGVHELLNLDHSVDVSPMFLKLHAWTLTVYDRVLLLDADMLAVTNIDPLLFAPSCMKVDLCTAYTTTPISSPTSRFAQEIGVVNYFNAGFLHLKPSMRIFSAMVDKSKDSKFLSIWAYEQDFLNQMVHLKILTHASIRPVGHFNKFPATRLMHYTSGKPWGWRSYPVHVPWTPRRKYWGIVRSWRWISIRYTLPGSLSLLSPSAVLQIFFPLTLIVVLSKELRGVFRKNINETIHEIAQWWVVCLPLAMIWIITIGAPRLKYDPGFLLPDSQPPTTAWLVVALHIAAVVSCMFPFRMSYWRSTYIVGSILITVCCIAVIELLHVNTSPWGILMIIVWSGLIVPINQVRQMELESNIVHVSPSKLKVQRRSLLD